MHSPTHIFCLNRCNSNKSTSTTRNYFLNCFFPAHLSRRWQRVSWQWSGKINNKSSLLVRILCLCSPWSTTCESLDFEVQPRQMWLARFNLRRMKPLRPTSVLLCITITRGVELMCGWSLLRLIIRLVMGWISLHREVGKSCFYSGMNYCWTWCKVNGRPRLVQSWPFFCSNIGLLGSTQDWRFFSSALLDFLQLFQKSSVPDRLNEIFVL